MFYAQELLSMKSKTDISLLYYISTTNNLNRRVHKKEILKLDINNTLENLIQQPYAMRLYSFILKGVVRLYLLKIRYYENDVNELLEMLRHQNKKRSQYGILNIENGGVNGSINNLYNNMNGSMNNSINNNMNGSMNNSINNNMNNNLYNNMNGSINNTNSIEDCVIGYKKQCKQECTDNYMQDSDMLYYNENINYKDCITRQDKVDEFIECDNLLQKYRNIKRHKMHNISLVLETYPIFNMIDVTNKDEVEYEEFGSLEFMRNDSTNTVVSRLSSSSISNTHFVDLLHKDETDFYDINKGSRYIQAGNFYILLECLCKGTVLAYQEYPYARIVILK